MLLKAFGQKKKSLRRRREGFVEYEKMCWTMNALCHKSKGRRWDVSQQLAERCKQRWVSDTCDFLLKEWEVWLTKRRRTSVDRLQRHEVWVDKLLDSADGGAGVAQISPGPDPGDEEHKSQKMSLRMRSL